MGKRLIIKGANFEKNGISVDKYVLVTTTQVESSYTKGKLNLTDVIDISKIVINEEYFIKVTSSNNKFKELKLYTEKDAAFSPILTFNVGEIASFMVDKIPERFILQSLEPISDYENADDTLTISVYKKET